MFAALSLLALAGRLSRFFCQSHPAVDCGGSVHGSVAPAGTIQMTATGTFDDGSTSNVTSKSAWQSSDTTVATVGTNTGLVKAAASIASPPGITTITATDGAFTNTRNRLPCANCDQHHGYAVDHQSAAGAQITFVAKAVFSGSLNQQDVTSLVTWTISNTAVISVHFRRGSDRELRGFRHVYHCYPPPCAVAPASRSQFLCNDQVSHDR